MAWWRLDDRNVPIEERAKKALEKHELRYGEVPNTLRVWLDCPAIKGLRGVTIERKQRIPKNVFETDKAKNGKRKRTQGAEI